jgi:hypothetical protein
MSSVLQFFKGFTNYNNHQSIGSKLRARRSETLLNIIKRVYAEKGSVSILDLEGSTSYWNNIPSHYFTDYNITVTILYYPGEGEPGEDGYFKFTVGDPCNLSQFDDQSFDIAHSNSVLEHMGDWERMVHFAKESQRVAKYYYVQTPNFWFPIEPHFMMPFFHWLPKPISIWLISHFNIGPIHRATSIDLAVRKVDHARLLNQKMLVALFDDANIIVERLFFIPKSFIAIRQQQAI